MNFLNAGLYAALPAYIKSLGLLQPKFFPFEVPPYPNQIHAINQAQVDPAAKFRLITDTIDGGGVPAIPSPLCYTTIGLTRVSSNEPPQTRGEVVLRTGSDGVVDIQSERAGTGTPLTEIQGIDICHALPSGPCTTSSQVEAQFLFGTPNSDTGYAYIASIAAALLTGPVGNFGPFHNPTDLTQARKDEIDAEIPFVSIQNLIHSVGPLQGPAAPHAVSSYTFMFTPDPSEPLDGTANWYGEVFSPEGVTTAGLTVTPDPLDSTHVTVDVDTSVIGDVALYLSYNSTTGHLIFGRPVLVVSVPPGANLTGIELHPNPITAMVGDAIGLEIWGLYDNGTTSQLFVQPDNSTFSSSNPNVASVDSGTGLLTAVAPGHATVTATYAGLTNEATINVPRSIPPRPRPSPHPRPTP